MSNETTQNPSKPTTRRQFMRQAGMTAAAVTVGAGGCARVAAKASTTALLGANERIGVGIIGCGGRASHHMGRLAYLKSQGANIAIVAVCDAYRPRLRARAEQYGAKAYMDYHELLADPEVDAVGIATPDHHHGYAAIDAVRAGKHVYCEKPVTHWRQFDLTKRLAAEVKKSGSVFQLGTQGMSDSAWGQMKQLIADGLIGRPIHAECGYFRVGDWGERGMPIDDPDARPGPDLDWEAFLGDAPRRRFDVSRFFRWRMYEDYSGGPVTDLFPHSLTPVISMLGVAAPSSVVASGGMFRYGGGREVPDTFNMLIDYPEKITVAVLGTQGNNYQGMGGRGAGGRIPIIRGWEGTLSIEGQEIVFIPAEGSDKKPQRFAIEHEQSIESHWLDFLQSCRDGTRPASGVDLAFHVQTALQMAMRSFHEGKTCRFDANHEKIMT